MAYGVPIERPITAEKILEAFPGVGRTEGGKPVFSLSNYRGLVVYKPSENRSYPLPSSQISFSDFDGVYLYAIGYPAGIVNWVTQPQDRTGFSDNSTTPYSATFTVDWQSSSWPTQSNKISSRPMPTEFNVTVKWQKQLTVDDDWTDATGWLTLAQSAGSYSSTYQAPNGGYPPKQVEYYRMVVNAELRAPNDAFISGPAGDPTDIITVSVGTANSRSAKLTISAADGEQPEVSVPLLRNDTETNLQLYDWDNSVISAANISINTIPAPYGVQQGYRVVNNGAVYGKFKAVPGRDAALNEVVDYEWQYSVLHNSQPGTDDWSPVTGLSGITTNSGSQLLISNLVDKSYNNYSFRLVGTATQTLANPTEVLSRTNENQVPVTVKINQSKLVPEWQLSGQLATIQGGAMLLDFSHKNMPAASYTWEIVSRTNSVDTVAQSFSSATSGSFSLTTTGVGLRQTFYLEDLVVPLSKPATENDFFDIVFKIGTTEVLRKQLTIAYGTPVVYLSEAEVNGSTVNPSTIYNLVPTEGGSVIYTITAENLGDVTYYLEANRSSASDGTDDDDLTISVFNGTTWGTSVNYNPGSTPRLSIPFSQSEVVTVAGSTVLKSYAYVRIALKRDALNNGSYTNVETFALRLLDAATAGTVLTNWQLGIRDDVNPGIFATSSLTQLVPSVTSVNNALTTVGTGRIRSADADCYYYNIPVGAGDRVETRWEYTDVNGNWQPLPGALATWQNELTAWSDVTYTGAQQNFDGSKQFMIFRNRAGRYALEFNNVTDNRHCNLIEFGKTSVRLMFRYVSSTSETYTASMSTKLTAVTFNNTTVTYNFTRAAVYNMQEGNLNRRPQAEWESGFWQEPMNTSSTKPRKCDAVVSFEHNFPTGTQIGVQIDPAWTSTIGHPSATGAYQTGRVVTCDGSGKMAVNMGSYARDVLADPHNENSGIRFIIVDLGGVDSIYATGYVSNARREIKTISHPSTVTEGDSFTVTTYGRNITDYATTYRCYNYAGNKLASGIIGDSYDSNGPYGDMIWALNGAKNNPDTLQVSTVSIPTVHRTTNYNNELVKITINDSVGPITLPGNLVDFDVKIKNKDTIPEPPLAEGTVNVVANTYSAAEDATVVAYFTSKNITTGTMVDLLVTSAAGKNPPNLASITERTTGDSVPFGSTVSYPVRSDGNVGPFDIVLQADDSEQATEAFVVSISCPKNRPAQALTEDAYAAMTVDVLDTVYAPPITIPPVSTPGTQRRFDTFANQTNFYPDGTWENIARPLAGRSGTWWANMPADQVGKWKLTMSNAQWQWVDRQPATLEADTRIFSLPGGGAGFALTVYQLGNIHTVGPYSPMDASLSGSVLVTLTSTIDPSVTVSGTLTHFMEILAKWPDGKYR